MRGYSIRPALRRQMHQVVFSTLIAGWVTIAANAAAADCVPTAADEQIWDSIKNSSEPREFLAYLKQFPEGCHRAVAAFKINALVDGSVALTAAAQFTQDPSWKTAKEQQWLDFGDTRVIEWLYVKSAPVDTSKFALDFQCDAAGRGLSQWITGETACFPDTKAPIQGASVRMRGSLSDFYTLKFECSTVNRGNGALQDYVVGDGDWCGVRAGTPKTYLYRVKLSIIRRDFGS